MIDAVMMKIKPGLFSIMFKAYKAKMVSDYLDSIKEMDSASKEKMSRVAPEVNSFEIRLKENLDTEEAKTDRAQDEQK